MIHNGKIEMCQLQIKAEFKGHKYNNGKKHCRFWKK